MIMSMGDTPHFYWGISQTWGEQLRGIGAYDYCFSNVKEILEDCQMCLQKETQLEHWQPDVKWNAIFIRSHFSYWHSI
jgi:hypothetical protein